MRGIDGWLRSLVVMTEQEGDFEPTRSNSASNRHWGIHNLGFSEIDLCLLAWAGWVSVRGQGRARSFWAKPKPHLCIMHSAIEKDGIIGFQRLLLVYVASGLWVIDHVWSLADWLSYRWISLIAVV